MVHHIGASFCLEILDNHFLHMAVARMAFANGEQRLNPFQPSFANADKNAGREGNARATSSLKCLQTNGW